MPAASAPQPALLTGFPGFIGRRLARRLLEADPKLRVVALVEPRMLDAARSVAEGIDPERLEILSGDISDGRLGLEDADYARLTAEVGVVYHLAAIYNLAVPAAVAQKVNVEGTANVLTFCRHAEKLQRLAYVSTAYVAGKRTGVVYEHELAMGQGFKNHYESTKFQAEVWVQDLMDEIPTTILRPAIVVGDSQTGETEKFDGPYYFLRTISRARAFGLRAAQFGRASAAFNVVPVDYIVQAIVAAAADPATAGEVLHLVDPEPLSTRDLVTVLSREYAGVPPRGNIPPAVADAALRLPFMRELLGGTPRESVVYMNHPVVYDARRAVELLAPHDLVPPRFADYVGPVVRFFAEHEHDAQFVPPPQH
jgi:thioester reductase-like protein